MKKYDLQGAMDRIDELEEALDGAITYISDLLGSDADESGELDYLLDVLNDERYQGENETTH
jgi:hypothetical protein